MDVRVGLWRKLSAKELMLWTVVLEKTLESPLDCKEIQPVHSQDQPWDSFGRNNVKAETPVLWPPHVNSWLIGKDPDAGRDWGQEEKGTTKDEMAGWHHRLDGCEFEWTPGDGDGQGGLACCSSWGHKELDMTEWLNWSFFTDCLLGMWWSITVVLACTYLIANDVDHLFNVFGSHLCTSLVKCLFKSFACF